MNQATSDPATDLSNEELVQCHNYAQAWLTYYQKEVGKFEQMIGHRMDANEAQALPDANGVIIVERKPKGSPEYDQGLLRAIIEVDGFGDEAYQECWIPEYDKEPVTVLAHWDMTQVKKWGRKLGKPVTDILDKARLEPGPGKLTFLGEGNDA